MYDIGFGGFSNDGNGANSHEYRDFPCPLFGLLSVGARMGGFVFLPVIVLTLRRMTDMGWPHCLIGEDLIYYFHRVILRSTANRAM